MPIPILLPLLAAFLWAVVGHLDKYIIDKIAENREVGALTLFSALAGVPVVVVLWLALGPQLWDHPPRTLLIMTAAGFLYVLGVIPYLYAMSYGETSSVMPQMLMVPLFTLVLGYALLGETLTRAQLAGGTLILAGALGLTFHMAESQERFAWRAFGMVMLTSLCFALNSLLFKYAVVEELPFWTAIFWEHVGFVIFSVVVIAGVGRYRRQFIALIRQNGAPAIGLNALGEAIMLAGNFCFHYAVLFAPVALVNFLAEGTQPFFVLLLGVLLSRFAPHIAAEDVDRRALTRKVAAVSVMVSGLLLIGA